MPYRISAQRSPLVSAPSARASASVSPFAAQWMRSVATRSSWRHPVDDDPRAALGRKRSPSTRSLSRSSFSSSSSSRRCGRALARPHRHDRHRSDRSKCASARGAHSGPHNRPRGANSGCTRYRRLEGSPNRRVFDFHRAPLEGSAWSNHESAGRAPAAHSREHGSRPTNAGGASSDRRAQ